jgi:Homeodomain-like domain
MNKSQAERNAAIVRLHQSGKRQSDIARRFKISPHRVRQIIETAERQKKHQAELEKKYGPLPDIPTLPDTTPIEVLLLCEGKIAGWAVRIGRLESPLYASGRPAIQTLGDLRSTTDLELLKEPNLGTKMVAELRRFCPPKTDETLERLFTQIRTLPTDRKAFAINMLRKLCKLT